MQTLDAFDRQFPTDDACKEYLTRRRWPDGVRCPRCGAKDKVYALKARPFHWLCKNADCGGRNGYRFSVITRTIFQDTKVPLKLWFKVGYLMLVSKKGISALQVHRVIFGEESGSDYHTSWYMCHRWRAAMRGDAFPLTGEVEVDETYVGGKASNAHRGNRGQKTSATAGKRGNLIPPKVGVVGAIARKGNVVCKVIGSMEAPTIKEFVHQAVSKDVSLIASDDHPAYETLQADGYGVHGVVHHRRGEYVRGVIHTANLDSFWSLFKRGVVGTFHKVSADYLPLYLNEFSFRHNNRTNMAAFGDLVASCGQ